MIDLAVLVQSVVLHSAWPGPGVPPPDYNAVVGDAIPANAPEQVWACSMRAPSKMGVFEVRISGEKLDRVFVDKMLRSGFVHYPMRILSNTTLGAVAVDVVNDIEDGRPGIGTYTFALDKVTGEAVFEATFAGDQHAAPADGRCTLKTP